jgi:alcohol dehydrogenase (cytochrome c)
MTTKQWLLSSLVASTCLFSITASAGPIENYTPVTADRLTMSSQSPRSSG